jgi:hypothetical protein
MVTVSTPNPKQHGLFSTRVVDRGFGACKGGERERREKSKRPVISAHKTRHVIKCTCLICKYAAVVCLIFFRTCIGSCSQQREALVCGCTSREQAEQRFAQLISARDCFRYSEPEIARRVGRLYRSMGGASARSHRER